MASLRITHLYTGDDGESHFRDLEMPLSETPRGNMSGEVGCPGVFFRTTPPGGDIDFHVAPRRQFVIHLAGRVEIELGDGSKREFGVGEILLADDTTGHGHISREVDGPRAQIFVPLADDVDIERWVV